jgi:electron transfer flavoprotein beta subunit
VLLGQQSDDGECYTVGAIVADHLRMPSLTQVIKLDVLAAEGSGEPRLRCERQAEYGYDTVEVELPAVISVGDAINEPRYPSLKAIMGAKKKPLETLALADVDLDASRVGVAGSAARWSGSKEPPRKPPGTIIEDEDTDATVSQIVAWLDERKLI